MMEPCNSRNQPENEDKVSQQSSQGKTVGPDNEGVPASTQDTTAATTLRQEPKRDESCDGDGLYLKYTIKNELQQPFFNASMKMKIDPCRPVPFIRYMEDAVMLNPSKFKRFIATFYPGLGYFISSISSVDNNVDENTYWKLSNAYGALNVGVSSYMPHPGDNIEFNFVKGKGDCTSSDEKA